MKMMMKTTMIDERIMEQQQQDNNDDANDELYKLTPLQLQASLYIPRILGIILVISSIFMFILAWKRRDRLFHRLVLGTHCALRITTLYLYYLLVRIRITLYVLHD
jgi:hypothetical protein